jgi:hypothetical protein
LANPRYLATMARLSARFRVILAVAVATSACAGGCSTVNRSVKSSVTATSSTSPTAVTVRAQSGDSAASPVTPGSAAPATPAPTTVVSDGPAVAPPDGPAVAPPDGAPDPPPQGSPAPTVVTGPIDTVLESLFGEASTAGWTPLLFSELFTQGWNQPFVFSPQSSSGAFRQEWINASDGVFYRQWTLQYNYRATVPPAGNADIGQWSIFAPLSRRLELHITVPFVDYKRVADPLPANGPGSPINRSATATPPTSYKATFGDVIFTPQVLLHETQDTSIMSILAIKTPTGSVAAGNGEMSLGPQIQFWQGLPNRWVIRGGAGPTIPLEPGSARTTFDTNLTIGKFLTLDEVRYFKEFTVWLAASNSATTDNRGPAADTFTLSPGIRFRIAVNTWFLYTVEIPLVAPRNEDFGMYFTLVRRW